MSARLPLLHKTPFVLDERLLHEATSPHAGLLSVSRAYRSLGLPDLIAANLSLRKRQRGFSEAQFVESISFRGLSKPPHPKRRFHKSFGNRGLRKS